MGRIIYQTLFGVSASVVSIACFASPGAVDDYDCHRDFQTNKYHCHGDEQQAKQSHYLFGLSSRTDVWMYDDGPLNLFTGGAGEMEFGFGHLAVHAGYSYQVHVTGYTDYTLSGWDVGLKAGPNIARLGLHPYADVGYYSQGFQIPNNSLEKFTGWQFGGGIIWNRNAFALDWRILKKTTTQLADFWDSIESGGLTQNYATALGLYMRF